MEAPPSKRSKASTSAGRKSTGATTSARGGGSKKKSGVTEKRMNELLTLLGVSDVERVSKCLKAAILKGHVRLEDPKCDPEGKWGLDQAVIDRSKCPSCDKEITCRVCDVLYQPDYAGLDYEDGGKNATFRCDSIDGECGGIYVTQMCTGKPSFDSGKSHNHCPDHPKYGYCIGDYREQHCGGCGKHYFAGLMGDLSCHHCENN